MITLAFKMGMSGPDDPWSLLNTLIYADLTCVAISLLWLIIAVITRKKGRPFHLHSTFWYFATPGIAGFIALIARSIYEAFL